MLSETAFQKKRKKKVTGWLHLATWVFLLILILCITMVNFLKFLWQIFNEVFDQFFWQQCRNRKSCSFLAINLFIFSAPGQDVTHFVSNGTKLNIPLQTKPPINDAMIINVSEKKSYLKNNLVLYYLTTATRIYWKNETTLRPTFCSNWVVSSQYLNKNYIVISDCIARKKKKKKQSVDSIWLLEYFC